MLRLRRMLGWGFEEWGAFVFVGFVAVAAVPRAASVVDGLLHPDRWSVLLDYETGKPVVVHERWWGTDTLRLPARFVRGQDGEHGSWEMGSGHTWMPVPLSSRLISHYDAGYDAPEPDVGYDY